ncbi:MAG: SRPBCC family protein [Actinobacteria bacterium]|nr:SRPBCC family protein [Actinomycetota bacterium]MCL6105470.1 SRPBCC family protein [Actinomycetota bacterium]
MAEQAKEKMIVQASLQHCYEIVADFERYVDWAADIKEVTVLERDVEGRPKVVEFRAAAFGRSTSYTLSYDYSAAPNQLSWWQTRGDLTAKLDGSYSFKEIAHGQCEVVYLLEVELHLPLPGFVKRRAQARIVSTALKELKARIESTGT